MFIPGESMNIYIAGAIVLVALGIIAINYRGRTRQAIGEPAKAG